MIVFTPKDLENMIGAKELVAVLERLKEEGQEVILYTCPNDRLYFGHLFVPSLKTLDFDRFVPSTAYTNVYLDLPKGKITPCPLCGSEVSTVRIERTPASFRVFSG